MKTSTYVTFPFPLPVLTVKHVPGGMQDGCRSWSLYEVVSRFPLDEAKFKHLDACGVIGVGQEYRVGPAEEFTEDAPPVTVDRLTGLATGEPPVNYAGLPITRPHPYVYYRYVVRRTCDSGD